jgi:glycosyltransferase involved in cell wall biosynthesis
MKKLDVVWGVIGGADNIVRDMEPYMRARGVETDILSYRNGTYTLNGVSVLGVDELAETVLGRGYDIIHVNNPTITERSGGALGRIRNGSKLLYNIHSAVAYDINRDLGNPAEVAKSKEHPVALAQEEVMRKADAIVSPTNFLKNITSKLYPESAPKLDVIPCCSDFSKYEKDLEVENIASSLRDELVSPGGKLVLYPGRIVYDKGVVELAAACGTLPEKYKTTLVYAGPIYEDLSNEIRSRGPKKTVMYGNVESRKKLAGMYKAADVVCIPTYHENFCISGLEALMMGTPLVISEIDGPKELYVDTGWARGIKPMDVASTKHGIEYVLSGADDRDVKAYPSVPPLMKRLGIAENATGIRAKIAQRNVSKAYDTGKVVNTWVEKYKRMLGWA